MWTVICMRILLSSQCIIVCKGVQLKYFMQWLKLRNLIHCRTGENFTSTFNQTLESQGCKSNESFALATHGWLASKNDPWVAPLIDNLINHRGGCIIIMDYSKIGNIVNYFALTPHFANISAVLLKKLKQLESENFDPAKGFMFGFSFGARLVIDAASKFGFQRFKNIDGKMEPKHQWNSLVKLSLS